MRLRSDFFNTLGYERRVQRPPLGLPLLGRKQTFNAALCRTRHRPSTRATSRSTALPTAHGSCNSTSDNRPRQSTPRRRRRRPARCERRSSAAGSAGESPTVAQVASPQYRELLPVQHGRFWSLSLPETTARQAGQSDTRYPTRANEPCARYDSGYMVWGQKVNKRVRVRYGVRGMQDMVEMRVERQNSAVPYRAWRGPLRDSYPPGPRSCTIEERWRRSRLGGLWRGELASASW